MVLIGGVAHALNLNMVPEAISKKLKPKQVMWRNFSHFFGRLWTIKHVWKQELFHLHRAVVLRTKQGGGNVKNRSRLPQV